MAKVKVYVTPKQGVLDPQGKTVESALHTMGYKNVSDVHIGKYIELELTTKQPNHPTTEKQINEMCQKLLSNPIIEDFRYEVIE
jgi:phosphoribosylformylglycinamidine synthase subunit PurS